MRISAIAITITFLDEQTDSQLNFDHFAEIFITHGNEKVWIYDRVRGVSPIVYNNQSVALAVDISDTIRFQWLYKGYSDYFYVEIQPWVANFFQIKIGVPGLINNTTVPSFYQTLFVSTKKIPIIVVAPGGYLKLASMTQHAYDRYLSNEAWLQRKAYNVYTIKDNSLVFLASIDGGKAQIVNLDALLASVKVPLYPHSLDIDWIDNQTMRVAFKILDSELKKTTIRVYVNDTFLTAIESIANELTGIVMFDQFNVTITNQTKIKIEVLRDGQLIAQKEIIGWAEKAFKLPNFLAMGLGIALLFFGLTLLGMESTIRFFGLVISFIVLAITSLAETQDTMIRILQASAIVLIIVFIAANLKGGGRV